MAVTKNEIIFRGTEIDRSDAVLWAACRAGDATTWDEIVARYQRLICTAPRRAGLSEDLVNEVFQEVILTLLEKLDTIEQPERLRAWLVTTAKYKSWKLLAQNRNFPRPRRVRMRRPRTRPTASLCRMLFWSLWKSSICCGWRCECSKNAAALLSRCSFTARNRVPIPKWLRPLALILRVSAHYGRAA